MLLQQQRSNEMQIHLPSFLTCCCNSVSTAALGQNASKLAFAPHLLL